MVRGLSLMMNCVTQLRFMENPPDSRLRKFDLFAVIVGDLLGYTGVGVGLGYLAWSRWNAPWWVLLLSTSLGLILAFYQLYRVTRKDL
jgi:F0F1-type ATP synthase assembly protein I